LFRPSRLNVSPSETKIEPVRRLDFQLKVHFNAGGVQMVQKRFLDRSFLTKAKLVTDFPKEVSDRRVSQHESHDNFFRPCDQIFLKPRDKNLAAAKSNSQRP